MIVYTTTVDYFLGVLTFYKWRVKRFDTIGYPRKEDVYSKYVSVTDAPRISSRPSMCIVIRRSDNRRRAKKKIGLFGNLFDAYVHTVSWIV